MTNIFVLCTGRCGSTTFAKAASHASNMTSGHETRSHMLGTARMAYPANHIEADNRLSWMLGRLEREWGDNALYVHLERDLMPTVQSFVARARNGIMRAYHDTVIMGAQRHKENFSDLDFALDYIDTVTTNIESFLSRRKHRFHVQLENAAEDFAAFWEWAKLEGDRDKALAEWQTTYNATKAS